MEKDIFNGRITTLVSNEYNMEESIKKADPYTLIK